MRRMRFGVPQGSRHHISRMLCRDRRGIVHRVRYMRKELPGRSYTQGIEVNGIWQSKRPNGGATTCG